ncbi:flagellar hook-basal body complex protein [Paraburkholderia bonniea]|uniref:flagellar hook-basal body complex protein n=1 Tax=Paraburkholderia bonniea TaxID=2152891 RepID=UPI0012918143|nr:flagellar hook-basal body complex protein [Paraburkholderia bonniea]WJF90792.1 flagellar hook-basal body complex protein [Paraburkholderia bonniea]WJF94106.1 flagellar hook-basal body complex protein [Paraburkholderia bonniea]
MSFNISLSGINAVNNQLNSISNNIANSGTYGFKSGRANFSSTYINAQPSGVAVGSTSQSISQTGNFFATGRGMDAAIQGSGFFVTRGSDGAMQFSRAGIFNTDKDGSIVDFLGRKVQGYGPEGGVMGDLSVPAGSIPASASTSLDYVGNMSADWKAPSVTPFSKDDPESYNGMSVATVHDSMGRKHTVTQYFVKGAGNEMEVHYAMNGVSTGTPTRMTFDTDGKLTAPTGSTRLDLGTPDGASPLALEIKYTGTTMFAGEQSTATNRTDGYSAGTVTGVQLAEDGSVEVQYSNGQKSTAGRVVLATFANENALKPISGSAWAMTSATGEPLFSVPGAGMAGKLAIGALEQSNVDMTAELVQLMGAQQNYQANSKVLSTENEMMRTLMQAL